jgi:FtsP/CotA-like multicopper oxidase with cupredoxin domain
MRSNFPVVLALLSTVTSSLLAAPCIAAQSAVDAERIAANDNRRPAGRLTVGMLTVRLEVRPGLLQPEEGDGPGVPALAFAEVGRKLQVPGPLIRVPQGTEIRVSVRNPFRDSTLTVYGLHAHPVKHDTALRIPGGETREVRFRGDTPGTYYYWGTTSGNSLVRQWFESQLTGALVVDAPNASRNDRVFVIGIWNRPGDSSLAVPRLAQEVMVINGKSWPHTERLTYARGDSVRWRWINATGVAHPMHLHGFYFQVESRGDWNSEREFRRDERQFIVTNLMLPGETMRVGWVPAREGNWLFHCHFAFHVSHHLALLRGEAGTPPPQPSAIDTRMGIPPAPHPAHVAGASAHQMAGLVLGISVGPGGTPSAGPRAVMPARNIRLIAQSAPKRFGSLTGLGYVVQEGAVEPPRDSIAIPGPTLVLRRGEPVRVTVVNRLAEPTAVHWHGIELESFPDGVPGWSGTPGRIMPPIAPGDSFVAEFVPPRAGTFIYHTHSNEQFQLGSGLYGALLVEEAEKPYDPDTDKVILVGGAGPADSLPQYGFESPGLVNGSSAPSPMDVSLGTTYRLRLININPDWRVIFSLMSDSALASWRPIAVDGADLLPSQRRERPAYLLTGPGQTADFEFTPTARGELRLEVKTQLSGWIIPIVVRVR